MKSQIKTIAIFTSGGDSPGMNAAIRAVVRTALHHNIKVLGIMHGYDGMIKGDFIPLDASSVGGIIHRGGTILKTARSQGFMTAEGRSEAAAQLKKHKIDAVVAIGGDGTFKGALVFSFECKIPFVGLPGTIDNDLAGTDFTIGFDTAVNTVIEAVDKIRDTAESHDRLFFVEVMGRDAGLIALNSGIGVGAEEILIPETKTYIDDLIKQLQKGWKRKKASHIIIVAEGDDAGGAYAIAEKVKAKFNKIDTRIAVLGHLQRGGNPTANDRLLSTRLGYEAVEALLKGKKNVMLGIVNNKVVLTPFKNAVKFHAQPDKELLKMLKILSE